MRFKKFLLDNYIATAEGQAVYNFFLNLPKLIEDGDKDNKIINFINSLLYQPIAEEFFNISALEPEEDNKEIHDNEKKDKNSTFEKFEYDLYVCFDSLIEQWECTYRDIQGEIPNLSLLFFYDAPDYALPYFYPVHFNIIQKIFNEFNIYLPPMPGPRQHRERCYYYVELCRSLYEFRIKHGLNQEELCVLLYGFGKNIITDEGANTLPAPNKAWIIGASQDDSIYTLPNITDSSIQWWAAQKNMQAGDIFFMYEVSPHQVIRLVWRAISEAYDDPFQYYAGKIWLTNAQKIPPITYKELTKHSVMSKNSLVRAHMQGCGRGPSLSNKEYKALLEIIASKNFDTSQFPELMSHSLPKQVDINNEQDVEQQLLEPFLAQLGITGTHITRQMPLRMGRGICYYPDYVINAKTKHGEEQGSFVWEAKYRITNTTQMLDALYQAKSYALRLGSNGLGLACYEGIWLSLANDKFSSDKIDFFSWQTLENPDTFAHVSSLLKKAFGKL